MFHVFVLESCICDPESIFPIEGLDVEENLSNEEVPVKILDRQVEKFLKSEVDFVRMLWKNHVVKGATWEAEEDMKSCYLIS